jgi:ribosome-binding factor A
MQGRRAVRVAEAIKRELGRIILREVKDPGVKLITITSVKLTDDLKLARIYYTVFREKENREIAATALNRALKFIRSEIGKNIELRYTPELEFHYDAVADYAENIENLFDKIKKEEQ